MSKTSIDTVLNTFFVVVFTVSLCIIFFTVINCFMLLNNKKKKTIIKERLETENLEINTGPKRYTLVNGV